MKNPQPSAQGRTIAARDRDPAGRAQQSRPRDALGRPLPYGSSGVEPFDERPLSPAEALTVAREYVTAGRTFAAHEVFEAQWKSRPAHERLLWQAMAQLCVASTHASRGNQAGARTVLGRCTANLRSYTTGAGPTHGLDLERILSWIDADHPLDDVSWLESVPQ